MRLALAAASLTRHRMRTALAVAGVAVSAAMLLDMVMLATGLRESFRSLLASRGFEIRVSPRGTLAFDGEATVGAAGEMVAAVRAMPGVAVVSPVLGHALHVPRDSGGAVSAFGIGMEPAVQADYTVQEGRMPRSPDEIVANELLLRATGTRLGDTISVATGYDPQLATFAGLRSVTIVGRARFTFLSAEQRAIGIPLGTLQSMERAYADRVSILMVRLARGADVDSVRTAIERAFPRVTALSTAKALEQAEQRLSYFRQLALVLGSMSLVVGFLLVTTLVTVSVNERVGEIAVMRAIGVSTAHVVQQVVVEGLALSGAGTLAGLVLGLGMARWLNSILSAFPGLPAAIDFFLLQPRAVAIALAMLVASGVLAGIFPAWRAASLPIAATLRREAVA